MSVGLARDIWMRHTDKDGNAYVRMHRVWDAPLFVATQADAAREVGGASKAEQITEEQFLKEKT